MGGADAVVEKARGSFEAGDLRWAAQVLDHVVFAEPDHAGAKALLADVLEQLGFGSENGTWRAAFLSGSMELRGAAFGTPTSPAAADILAQLTPDLFFDAVAVQVDGPKAWDLDIATRWAFPDHGRRDLPGDAEERRAQPRPRRHGRRHADDHRAEGGARRRSRSATSRRRWARACMLDGDASVLQSVLGVLDPGDPELQHRHALAGSTVVGAAYAAPVTPRPGSPRPIRGGARCEPHCSGRLADPRMRRRHVGEVGPEAFWSGSGRPSRGS